MISCFAPMRRSDGIGLTYLQFYCSESNRHKHCVLLFFVMGNFTVDAAEFDLDEEEYPPEATIGDQSWRTGPVFPDNARPQPAIEPVSNPKERDAR